MESLNNSDRLEPMESVVKSDCLEPIESIVKSDSLELMWSIGRIESVDVDRNGPIQTLFLRFLKSSNFGIWTLPSDST